MWLLQTLSAMAIEPPKNAVISDLGLHVIGLGFQRTATPGVALQVAADLYVPWTQNDDVLGISEGATGDTRGFVLRVRPFFHPAGTAPTGWWISPFAQAGIARATVDDLTVKGSVWATGVSAGYGGLIANHLLLSGGVGGQVHAAHYPGASGSPSFTRLYPTIDGIVGYAF